MPRARSAGGGYFWGLSPARTVVRGAAPRGSGAVVLRGAGAPRRVRVDPRRGGFFAVLDGRIDPRALRVSVGGRALPATTVGRRGQALAPETVPAWRSVATAARGLAPRDVVVTDRSSIAVTLHASDPTGGPGWALRSWIARIDPRVRVGGRRDLVCFAIGTQRGAELVEPRAGGTSRVVGTGQRDGNCREPRPTLPQLPGVVVRTYVDDPEAPDPRPTRVVVAGMIAQGVRSAQLLGAGQPRPLELDRHGAFLVVLGPEHAGSTLRLREVRAGGAVQTSVVSDLGIQCEPRPGRSVRVADPDGGPSWTIGYGRIVNTFRTGTNRGTSLLGPIGGGRCRYIGRLAGERLAFAIDGETWLRYGAYGFSWSPATERKGRGLTLEVQGPGSGPERAQATGRASAAQVARRTLPGRTIVMGTASSDVTSVTLTTPRDVRTVRPGAGGVFLAVYDGPFYGGTVRATAHLKNGRDTTVTRPASGF